MERRRAIAVGTVLAAVAIAVVALVMATYHDNGPMTLSDRVDAIASDLRCPVCQNLSVADSPSLIARQMRATIGSQLESGATPDEVKAYFVQRYGRWILLSPDASGPGLLLWILPALALIVGAAIVLARFRRPRTRAFSPVTADEHETIERELAAFEQPQ